MRWVTVDDMWNHAKQSNLKLLSEFNSGFWADYNAQHTYYDRQFKRMFGSFRFFDQTPVCFRDVTEEEIANVTEEFINAVYDHLLINTKRYSELYRVQVLSDEQYSILNNYDITETKQGTTGDSGSNVAGTRTDGETETLGSYEDTETHTEGEREDLESWAEGEREDTEQVVDGSRTDTVEKVEGARTDTTTQDIGARSDSSTNIKGSQTTTRENGIAGFNSASFSDDTNSNETEGQRTDTVSASIGAQENETELVKGAQTDSQTNVKGQQTTTNTFTKGEQSNSKTFTKGEQTINVVKGRDARSNSRQLVKGAQTDTFTKTGTEQYTLRRVGTINVSSIPEVLNAHKEFWTAYDYYTYIFKQICADLLLI